MNLFYLSFKNVVAKPLSSFLSVLLFGFGISIIVLILLVSSHLKNEISKNAEGIDLVIGAKGSPMQLILANIFQVDFPTGNISLKESAELTRNRLIEEAIPMSLGDSYAGFRILGTTVKYLEHYNAEFVAGSWTGQPMEVVLGVDAASFLDLEIGDQFESTHGLAETGADHGDHPFKVMGILRKTGSVIDKLILVSIPSVWEVHGHEENSVASDSIVQIPHMGLEVNNEQYENEEITALLIKYASPMAAIRLPQMVNKNSNFQAASPAFETARLFTLIGTGIEVMTLLGIVIIVISAVSVFIALINSLKERKYELAILRSIGAGRFQLFLLVLIEGFFLTVAGVLLGFGLSHGGFLLLGQFVETINITGLFFVEEEIAVFVGALTVGIISAIIPAMMAYKANISSTLAKG